MRLKKFLITLITIFIAIICFFTGCSTSQNWVRQTIENYYFRFDGDYSDFENMGNLTVEEMIKKLDIYSAYYTKEQYAQVVSDNAGNKSGIGISYAFEDGRGAVIHSVVGNSPARKAGIKAGDVVVSSNYENGTVEFKTASDFSEFVAARAEGEPFTFNLADGNSLTLSKEQYSASYASMYTSEKSYNIEYEGASRRIIEDSSGGIPQLPEKTAYIYMYQFYGGVSAEMADLIAIFNAEGCTSMILDLRDNGGGYVNLMAEIGGLFTARLDDAKDHIAMVAKFKDGSQSVEKCVEYARGSAEYAEKTVPAGTEIYVLANEGTASASEALIGILVSYGILDYENIFLSAYEGATPKTYGKGIMQSVFTNYVTGEALKLTVAGIYWANGKTIHGTGLNVTEHGCTAAPAGDRIVNVGYDDELNPVIDKIRGGRQAS